MRATFQTDKHEKIITLQTVTQDLRFDSGDLQNDNGSKISFCDEQTNG